MQCEISKSQGTVRRIHLAALNISIMTIFIIDIIRQLDRGYKRATFNLIISYDESLGLLYWIHSKQWRYFWSTLLFSLVCCRVCTTRCKTVSIVNLMLSMRQASTTDRSKMSTLWNLEFGHMWCDQAKSVWSRSYSDFSFLLNRNKHLQSYILQKTPLKLNNQFKRYQ